MPTPKLAVDENLNFDCSEGDMSFFHSLVSKEPISIRLFDGTRHGTELSLIINQLASEDSYLLFKAVCINTNDCYSGIFHHKAKGGHIGVVEKEKLEW